MKIQVSKIDYNPYRNIDSYPINRVKVDSLKISITQTGFWDNILVRPFENRYQLAYGHHRLIAIKEIGITEVDIPVKELDDVTMFRVMANENMTDWSANPAVVNETVHGAKKLIDSEIAKYKTWDLAPSFIKELIVTEPAFRNIKARGSGGETILKFLGDNWKQWMIQSALATINSIEDNTVDKNAVEAFDRMEVSNEFRRAVVEAKVPIEKQFEIAKKIIASERDSKREVRQAVEDVAVDMDVGKFDFPRIELQKPTLDMCLERTIDHAMQIYSVVGSYFEHPEQVSADRMKFLLDLLSKIETLISQKIGEYNELNG